MEERSKEILCNSLKPSWLDVFVLKLPYTKYFLLTSCVRLMRDTEQSGLLGFTFSEAFKSQVKTYKHRD